MINIRRMKKSKLILIVIALLLSISIGYAYLTQVLTVDGTSRIGNISWDVHFENVTPASGGVTPATAPVANPQDKVTSLEYALEFTTAGDSYDYTVDIVNAGTVDAKLQGLASRLQIGTDPEVTIAGDNSNIPSYIEYSVTDNNDRAIVQNHLLEDGNSETIKVHIKLKDDATPEQIAELNGKQLLFHLDLNATPADGTEVNPTPTSVYVVSETTMNIGQQIPAGVNARNTPAEAMADWQDLVRTPGATKPFYLKYVLDGNNNISESYVGFAITEDMAQANPGLIAGTYYLKGGDSGTAFLDNAKTIYDAFGGVGCSGDSNMPASYDSSYNPNPTSRFYCYASGLRALASSDGGVDAYDDDHSHCDVNSDGSSYCVA